MLVAYLQDTQLTVAVGTGGIPATVEKVLTCPNLNGMVRDGSIVDATGFQGVVGEFWRNNGLETKDVKVVVRSRRITLQKIDAPVLSAPARPHCLPRPRDSGAGGLPPR